MYCRQSQSDQIRGSLPGHARETHVLLEVHWSPQFTRGFSYGGLCSRAALAPWRYVPMTWVGDVSSHSHISICTIHTTPDFQTHKKRPSEFVDHQDAYQQVILSWRSVQQKHLPTSKMLPSLSQLFKIHQSHTNTRSLRTTHCNAILWWHRVCE